MDDDEPNKKPLYDGYVFIIVDDTPYNVGVEHWFNNDLKDMMNDIHSEWDWLISREISLAKFKYGQDVDYIEGILPFDEEKFGLEDTKLYPLIDTNDDYKNVHFCRHCGIFECKPGVCKRCEEKLLDATEKAYC